MTIVPWMLCRLDWSDKHTPKIVTSGRNKSSPHSPGLIYRGDGVDGVHDCEQKDVVDTSGIVWVSRSGDLLTGGVVYEGWVAGDVHLVVCGVGYGCGWTVHVLILHQRLALVWHHHHITETKRWYLHQTFVYDETIQNKSLYSFFFFQPTWWLQTLAGPPQGQPRWRHPRAPGHEPPLRGGSCVGLRIPAWRKSLRNLAYTGGQIRGRGSRVFRSNCSLHQVGWGRGQLAARANLMSHLTSFHIFFLTVIFLYQMLVLFE